jgi:hypothetical protein
LNRAPARIGVKRSRPSAQCCFGASVERTKQFRLQTERDFANFIEKERTAIG